MATCPADNINPEGQVLATLPECSLFCSDPDPVPAGYEIFIDYLGTLKSREMNAERYAERSPKAGVSFAAQRATRASRRVGGLCRRRTT